MDEKEELIQYSFKVKIFNNREALGKSAAADAGDYIRELLKKKDEINCIFAAAPSQNEFLKYLINENIDWHRINAFHMDEYIGLMEGDTRKFSHFLKVGIFDRVNFKKVYYIDEKGIDTEETVKRYGTLMKKFPVDITFMGIGENGHIAFNDPHVANFKDRSIIKIVDLDDKCRRQQVNDGCFESLEEVPKYAATLTIPTLMNARRVFCMVPSNTKAEAVKSTVFGTVSEECPATIMRKHVDSTLYVDRESAKYIL